MRAAREAAAGSSERAGSSASGPGAGARPGAGKRSGPARPFGWSTPLGPPPESKDWDREQWRDWKRQQQEQWRAWKDDFTGQRDQWRDWQRAWKEQWARQWKEQWEEQWESRQRQQPSSPWGWLFGGSSPFWGHEEPEDAPGGTGGSGGSDEPGSGPRARRGFDWDMFGPQLRDIFERLRHEAGPLFDTARRHGPLSETEQAEVREVIERAVTELRAIFERRGGSGGERPTDSF
jgi:hypothetical protein